MKRLLAPALLSELLLGALLLAQDVGVRSSETGQIAVRQAVCDAATDIQVLLVAAHPDDTYLLLGAYLRFARGWRVDVVLMTRGEGGQNLSGPEVGEELRRIRTLEAEAAAERLGLRLWYANLPDHGFARSAADAFADWGRDNATQRLATLVRKVRPDFVMTTHHPQELHGHDLALLQILAPAIELASDPTAKGVTGPPVRVDKVFRAASPAKRASRPDEKDQPGEPCDGYLQLDEVDGVRGDTYRRIAYRVLEEEHKTQRPIEAMETLFARQLGLLAVPVFGKTALSNGGTIGDLFSPLPSLFAGRSDGAELRDGLEGLSRIGEASDLLREALRLRRGLRLLRLDGAHGTDAELRRQRRIEALDRVIVNAAGLRTSISVERDAYAVAGEPLAITVRVHTGTVQQFEDVALAARGAAVLKLEQPARREVLGSGTCVTFVAELTPGAAPSETRATSGEAATNPFQAERFVPPLQLELHASAAGEPLIVPVVVRTEVRPALELVTIPRSLLLPSTTRQATFVVRVRRNTKAPVREKFRVDAPTSWAMTLPAADVVLDQELVKDFTLGVALPELVEDGRYSFDLALGDARTRLNAQRVTLQVDQRLNVGIVRGVDDAVESALRGLGVRLRVLADDDLALGDLTDLRTIIVDIRALKLREAARASFGRLLSFASGGGRLVVLYHKDVEFNVESAHFRGWPYPLVIGKGRITNEHAPVTVLAPEHPLLTVPNRIRDQDWDGWVQERGLYFAESYDPRYEALLAMRDDKAAPEERGALIYARCGSGEYVYCALSLFRQLKQLHAGACRLLVNLITPRT